MAKTVLYYGDIVEETLQNLYRPDERPAQVTVGSQALSTTSTTTFTVSAPDDIHTTDVLENGSELMLVTNKTDAATPVFTAARGYFGTEAEIANTGDVLLINPTWPRHKVETAITRYFQGPANALVPNITSQVMNRETGLQYVLMPVDTLDVLGVRHLSSITGRMVDIAGWQLEQDLPSAVASTGQILRLPSSVWDDDDLIVTYSAPYEFSESGDNGYVEVPLGTEDLPALWAAAYNVARREVTRVELDKIEEWNEEQAVRSGYNIRLLRELWGEFYRRVDEARKIQNVPKHRTFRKMARIK